LRKYIWNNKKIAYIRNAVKDIDETMQPDAWYKKMERFCQSPKCKLMVSFQTLKVKHGNSE
jgi:hypothetical protein